MVENTAKAINNIENLIEVNSLIPKKVRNFGTSIISLLLFPKKM